VNQLVCFRGEFCGFLDQAFTGFAQLFGPVEQVEDVIVCGIHQILFRTRKLRWSCES